MRAEAELQGVHAARPHVNRAPTFLPEPPTSPQPLPLCGVSAAAALLAAECGAEARQRGGGFSDIIGCAPVQPKAATRVKPV